MVSVFLASSSLQREVQITNQALKKFGLKYRLVRGNMPAVGDVITIGGPSKWRVGRCYDEGGRRVVKLPLIGKAGDDDLTKNYINTSKAAYLAARVFAGNSLSRDFPWDITSQKLIIKMLERLPQDEIIWFDFETTGLDPINDEIVMVSVAFRSEAGDLVSFATPKNKVGDLFKWLSTTDRPLGVANMVFEQRWFIAKLGTEANIKHDIFIDHCLLFEEQQHSLTLQAGLIDFWGYDAEMDYYLKDNKCAHHEVPEKILGEYAAGDSYVTAGCFNIMSKKHENEPADTSEVRSWMIRAQNTLSRMMHRGMKVDEIGVMDEITSLTTRKNELYTKLRDVASEHGMEDFNPTSSKQRTELLFNRLEYIPTEKTKAGQPSTGKEALEKLYEATGDEIVKDFKDWASIAANDSGFLSRCQYAVESGDGFMRTNFSATKLLTGQLSSTEPPMQNVPKSPVRRIFTSRHKNGYIAEFDYSQLHLRIIGNLAQCEGFIDAYLNDIDLHAKTTAGVVTDYDLDTVMRMLNEDNEFIKDARSKAKRTNFSIIFEVGARALASKLKTSVPEASKIIKRFFVQYPEIGEQIERQHQYAQKHGYVISPMGRVRHLPNANHTDRMTRFRALRQAGDYLISNSGRYITMYSMIMIDEEFIKRGMKSEVIMQVHDSVVMDIHPKEIDDVVEIVELCMVHKMMEYTADWMDPIPLEIDGFIGPNWYEGDAERKVIA